VNRNADSDREILIKQNLLSKNPEKEMVIKSLPGFAGSVGGLFK